MARILLDEDMPRSLGIALRQAGHEVLDVRELGLRGSPDKVVFEEVHQRQAALLTSDKGFVNPDVFALTQEIAIILVRLPESVSADAVTNKVESALARTDLAGLGGAVVVIEAGRVRIRRYV